MNPRWVRHNKVSVAIILYIILFTLINLVKPAFMYNPDGTIKEFGVGFRKKTIIPIWLISIFLAITSKLHKIKRPENLNFYYKQALVRKSHRFNTSLDKPTALNRYLK